MTRTHKQGAVKRFFHSRLFLIVLLIFITLVAISYARAYYQHYTVQKEIKALQEEIASLEKRKLESVSLLEYVQSDAFIEEKARTELNLKKPGEQVLFVKTDDISRIKKEREIANTTEGRQDTRNIVKWWYYFTKHNAL